MRKAGLGQWIGFRRPRKMARIHENQATDRIFDRHKDGVHISVRE